MADIDEAARVVAEKLLGATVVETEFVQAFDTGLHVYPLSWLRTYEGMGAVIEGLKAKGYRHWRFEWEFQTQQWWAYFDDYDGYADTLPDAVLLAASEAVKEAKDE